MAKLDLPANKWPTLLPFIYECCNHAETVRREVGVYVLDSLFETIADQMAENIPQLLELFSRLLRDPESHQVRVATVRALGQVAELIDTDDKQNIAAFQSLVPDMGQVLEQSLERGDEDSASSCFEVFNTLLLFETPLLSRHFSELIGFAVKVGCNTEMDDNLRIMALNFLVWAATYKRSRLLKLNLVQSLIEQLMPITTEEDPADADDESPSRVALRVLNVLSTSLPPQQVFPTAIRLILQYMDSQNPMHRKGAMLALAITVEGCVDFIRSQVSDLVQLITRGMHDQDVRVRRAACLALGCIADEMDQDIAQHHSTLLPIIFELLNESETDIIKHACNALDAIVEGLSDEQIAPYMPSLMEKLVVLLDNGPMEVRPMALAAIGSAAHAAGTQFLPYFDAIIGRTKQAMSLTASASSDSGNSLTSLRGVATDTAATLAEAVGKEKFQPHLADTVKLALEGMSLDSPNLRDCGFCFFGVLSRVFSDEFGDFLPYIVPEVLKTFATEDIPSSAAALDLDGEDGDDEDDDSDDFQVSTAIADEKEVAADCVAELYRNTRSSFVPYVESITTQLLGLLDHYSDTTRKAAVAALFSFLKVTSSMAQDPHWESGKPLKVPVHQNVETMIKTIVPAILKMWEEEDDKMVVAQICTELRSTMQLVGPAVVLNGKFSITFSFHCSCGATQH
ncbi:hypothetical protein EV182_003339 [Spiromyces aspiralis]|uniref:Uncharacterized protein n=1 Tax=Spiromyces aspiralis TaxID=68401 RepID=A0ACC1HRZ7_9FUNG|nr:hypothetical protein EV182_003339 [Spiromyces aspiralis]